LRSLFEKLIDDEQELDWFLTNVVTEDWHALHDAGAPFAKMAAERIVEFPDYRLQIEAYTSRFPETITGPVEGMHEIVRQLSDNNIPLYALSNFGRDAWEQFRPTASIFDLFSGILISGEEGIIKPDPSIYQLALNRFDLCADQCLFIDDRLENIESGERLGIAGHHFDNAADLTARLESLQLL